MNAIIERQNPSGSVSPLLEQLRALGTWPPTPEQIAKFKAEKVEAEFQAMKRRFEYQDRKLMAIKRRAREAMQGNRDGDC